MTRQHVTWDDFTGGDYGDLGGWNAPKGTWTGVNMKVDRDGSLCPRKGAVDLAPTGLGSGATDPYWISGIILPSGDERRIFVLFGSSTTALRAKALWAEQTTGQAWIDYTNGASWPLYSNIPEVVDDESESYFANADPAGATDVLVKADHRTLALSEEGTGAATRRTWLHALAAYGDRMFSVRYDEVTKRNRITFSNAPDDTTNVYDYGSLPAGNYIDVGGQSEIRRLQVWRNALLIFKPTEVWKFEGNPAGNASLRRLGVMTTRTHQSGGRNYAVADDQTLWLAGDGRRPVVFDGVKCVEVAHIDLGRARTHQVAAMNNGDGGVVYYEGLDRYYDSDPSQPAVNEAQVISASGTVSSWELQFSGQAAAVATSFATTTAAQIQSRLESMSNIAPGDVSVAGATGGPFLVTFTGTYAGTNVPQMTAGSVVGGGTVSFYTVTPGGYPAGTPGYDWVWTGKRWVRWQLTRPTATLLQTDAGGTGPTVYPRVAVVQRAFGKPHLFWLEKQYNGATTTVPLYRLDLTADGPGLSNSPFELPGDGSTSALSAQFSLPYFVAPERQQAQVRKIVVRGKRYRTNGASTNHFDIAVAAKHRFRDAADTAATAQSWDEANASAGASLGAWTTFEAEFSANYPSGQALEISFTNVRGVAITSVTADVDIGGTNG